MLRGIGYGPVNCSQQPATVTFIDVTDLADKIDMGPSRYSNIVIYLEVLTHVGLVGNGSKMDAPRVPSITCDFETEYLCGYEVDSSDNMLWRQTRPHLKLSRSNNSIVDYGTI